MSDLSINLQQVRGRIAAAARAVGRTPEAITLLAVSKTHPAEAVRAAFGAGQQCFGESYVQEALPKIDALTDLELEWHFIGPIQSNKTRDIAAYFDWVHGLDRDKIARRLDAQRPALRGPLNVCIQVNVSGETSKAGVSVSELPALARSVAELPNLRLRGLMTVPAPAPDSDARRRPFRELRQALEHLQKSGLDLDTLSMGMSDDLEGAIAEGATLVRIGTAIFGPRQYGGTARP